MIPSIQSASHMKKYDYFDVNEIDNYEKLVKKNEHLKNVVENYKQSQSVVDIFINLLLEG